MLTITIYMFETKFSDEYYVKFDGFIMKDNSLILKLPPMVVYIQMIYIIECRQHKQDKQPYDTSKWRSESKNTI